MLDELKTLAMQYRKQFAQHGRDGLNETETRSRFLDNVFRELGWPVGEAANSRVRLEPYHLHNRPDYEFLSANQEIEFVVEAKRASDPDLATFDFTKEEVFQAKRYAYSIGVGLVLLTNFALTRVFFVTGPPDILSPHQYELSNLRTRITDIEGGVFKLGEFFSIQAVDNDSRSKLQQIPSHGFKSPVTAELLDRLLKWRISIANGFLKANPAIDDDTIDHAASLTIDRILLSKILIDRDLEDDFLLAWADLPQFGDLLRDMFGKLHNRYNGSLFEYQNIDKLSFPDALVSKIAKEVSADKFPFDLSSVPVEILGDIYESFTGLRLRRARSGSTLELELKEESKKQKGVFFTPAPTVRAMTHDALAALLSGKTYKQLLNLRIVDPACGSGSFLVAAYRVLLSHALDFWKSQADSPAKRKALRKTTTGEFALTITIRREILGKCIYGVDLDYKSLEISALSLYLVLLGRDERAGLFGAGQTFPELLEKNLVQGDSLAIAFSGPLSIRRPLGDVDKIIRAGGFDVVLMNPPYVFGEWLPPDYVAELKRSYQSLGEQADLYAAFIEIVVTAYCRANGIYSIIVPDALLARAQRRDLRELMLSTAAPVLVYHVGAIFQKMGIKIGEKPSLERKTTGVSAVVLVGTKQKRADVLRVCRLTRLGIREVTSEMPYSFIIADPLKRFLIYVLEHERDSIGKLISLTTKLSSLLSEKRGEAIGRGEELGKSKLSDAPSTTSKIPLVPGQAVEPYHLGNKRYYVGSLTKKKTKYLGSKILVRKTDNRCFACRSEGGEFTLQSVYMLKTKTDSAKFFVLALLNSSLINWFLKKTVTSYKLMMPQLTQDELLTVPIPDNIEDYEDRVLEIERLSREFRTGLLPGAKTALVAKLKEIDLSLASAFGITLPEDVAEDQLSLF